MKYLVKNGVNVSSVHDPFDRSLANIGTLPRQETIKRIEQRRRSNAELTEDW